MKVERYQTLAANAQSRAQTPMSKSFLLLFFKK